MRGLARLAAARGARVHEHAVVAAFDGGRALLATGRRVRARTIVLATNGYTPRLGALRRRVFALLSMGLANCFIVDWDAKFTYNYWRPLTAIRNGDQDGNDATERDAGWVPLNATPMHPEYPSQAGINAGAAAGVLESVFGTGPASFTTTDIGDARLQRRFTGIRQMVEEHEEVRIWGGIHFRNSLKVGETMGRKIADHLVTNYLKPAR